MNSEKIVADGTGGRKSKALQEVLADLERDKKWKKFLQKEEHVGKEDLEKKKWN